MPAIRSFSIGQRVYALQDGRTRPGHVVCCEYPSSDRDSVGVRFDDGGEPRSQHIPVRDIAEARPSSPWTIVVDDMSIRDFNAVSMNRMAASLGYVSDALNVSIVPAVENAAETLTTLGGQLDQVGTTNNENEGEEMPNATSEVEVDTIQVPHSTDSLRELFNSMDMSQSLMQGLDADTWEAHRQELLGAIQDIPWRVRRGSFAMDSYPAAEIGRNVVRIRNTPLSVAQEFLASASNGRVSLTPVEGSAYNYRLKTLSNLEDSAWLRYGGGASLTLYSETVAGSDQETIDLRNLSVMIGEFSSFMNSRDHRAYIQAAIRDRMSGQDKATSKESVRPEWTRDRAEQFKTFLKGVKGRLRPEENPFQKLPILPHKTLSSRTWGIEIEAVDIAGVKTPEYWQLKGDGSLRNLSVASVPSRTKPAEEVGTTNSPATTPVPREPNRDDHDEECSYYTDMSEDDFGDEVPGECDCGYSDEYQAYMVAYREYIRTHGNSFTERDIRSDTGEWNSPVLRSYHSRGLKYITDQIEGRNTNDSAGVHVHVGAKDLSAAQAIQLSIIYTALEPLFESEYRRGNTRSYCKSPDVPELINRFNALRSVKKAGLKASDMRFSSRYWTVNLAALASHNTIEFRAMGSVYNYDHLVRWAYFCRELVNIAKANVPQSAWSKVRTIEDLVTLFAKYGKETPTPEWAATEIATDADIMEALGSENRRLPQWTRLNPDNRLSPLLVNDDYSAAQTYFLGERPAERSADLSYSF